MDLKEIWWRGEKLILVDQDTDSACWLQLFNYVLIILFNLINDLIIVEYFIGFVLFRAWIFIPNAHGTPKRRYS
jgi:hypothetical protein